MLYIRLCSNHAPFLFILYDQRFLPSTYNTPLYHNSSIFTEFGYIILKKRLLFGLSCDVELASTIIKVGLICPNYTILLRDLLVPVYLGPELAIFYMLWRKKRLLCCNSSKVLFLLKGGDKNSLVYVISKLVCGFFAKFGSLLVVEGGMGNKPLSNWSCKVRDDGLAV